MLLMTSNRAAEFSKGMLRAGRIDRMIEIGALNREATEEMIRRVVGKDRLEDDIDFVEVHKSLEGFEPAFVRQTFDQAATAALIRKADELRTSGKKNEDPRKFKLGTADFVNAANILRPQHDMHRDKSDERSRDTLAGVFKDTIVEAMAGHTTGQATLKGDGLTLKGEIVTVRNEVVRV